MILALILLLTEICLGLKIISIFRVNVKSLERFLYALIVGLMAGTFVVFLVYLAFELNAYSILFSVLIIAVISRDVLLNFPKMIRALIEAIKKNSLEKIQSNLFPVALFCVLFIFFSSVSFQLLESKGNGLYASSYTWADMPIHLSFITSFVENTNRAMEYPIYAGVPFTYHFMIDFLTATLIVGGFSASYAVFFVSALLLTSAFLLFFLLSLRLTKNRNVAALSVLLFICMGGLGFLYFLDDAKHGHGLARDYTAYPEKGIEFGGPLEIMIPGRSGLIGFPIMFIVFSILWRNLSGKINKNELLFVALIIGMSPLFHLYSFIFSAFIASCVLICFLRDSRKKILLPFFGIISILSLPQVAWLFNRVGSGFLRIHLGWLAHQNWLEFWIFNLGVFFVLAIPAFIFAERNLKRLYLPFIFIFVIGNVVALSPHLHDNISLFHVWGSVTSILIASLLYRLFTKNYFYKILVNLLIFFSILSGLLAHAWHSQHSWRLFDNEEIELSYWVKENTPKDSIFLISTHHTHFIPALTGRRVAIGYGWALGPKGIDSSQRQRDISSIFLGGRESLELLKKYDVDYISIGPSERSDFSANESFFDDNFQLVKESISYKIYRA